ncbi:MAG: GxxExxY protein [Bacteroidia bacterium]|nr:GxxExxY protein [Bacteroidia bacterium]MBP7437203.1 GxxExxY protein [Bacteroidia bacterium]MBP7728486.1 GxxExxY protein [Bacteroidia bacterium]MBP7772467.1 GxxExxY protein [Bacteroidia bacterium]
MLHDEITSRIIASFYRVYRVLGYGFLEKVYERAMVIDLRSGKVHIDQQVGIKVYYNGQIVGNYYADLLAEGKVIIELKAVDVLAEEHELQLINYLKATDIEVGLLLNFGPRPQVIRKIFTNDRKNRVNP